MNKEYVLNKLAQSREPEYFNYSTVSKQVADSLHRLPPDKKKNWPFLTQETQIIW